MLHQDTTSRKSLHNLLLCTGLFALVLISNYAIIRLSPVFPEQPPIYLANQQIHSFADLINVYLNPQMLYAGSIPYFRPSGHFLIYQLLTPLLGWHNIRGLFFVSFFFLALTGYGMIKVYELLFPNFKIGGYIAFCIFMMHPALILSRFILLQFDYAYACFSVFSLYFFILFCQKNKERHYLINSGQLFNAVPFKTVSFQYLGLFLLSLFLYSVAVSFKEAALLLGMVLCTYFLITFYQHETLVIFIKKILSNTSARHILLLLTLASAILTTYISLQWTTGPRPLKSAPLDNFLFYGQVLLGMWGSYKAYIFQGANALLFTPVTRIIWWAWLGCLALGTLLLLTTPSTDPMRSLYKRSLVFLYAASILFTILPIIGGNFPWHLLLTLLTLSLAIGFSFEYLLKRLVSTKMLALCGILSMELIIGDGIYLNNLHLIESTKDFSFIISRNAILHPPALRDKLKPDSILIVEENERLHHMFYKNSSITIKSPKFMKNGSYLLGDSYYPFRDQKAFTEAERGYFLKPHYTYNGTLFRWAYLMPNLREEVYPFNLDAMNEVPDDVLYNWLQNYKHIFAVSYDEKANWHDISTKFKAALLQEQTRRKLIASTYINNQQTKISGHEIVTNLVPVNNPQLCQLACDQNKKCKGTVFNVWPLLDTSLFSCTLYDKVTVADKKSCSNCLSYIKS